MSEIQQQDAQPKTADAGSIPLALNKDTIQDLDVATDDGVKGGMVFTTVTVAISRASACCGSCNCC